MITTIETWEGGVLVSREEIEVADPAPVNPDDLIANVAAMTDNQKADLRAALGL